MLEMLGITNRFAGAYSHEPNEDPAQRFSMQNGGAQALLGY